LFAHGADLLIAEATLPVESEPDARSGHLTASDAAVLAALADVHMLLLTHYWEPLDEANTRALVHRSFSGSVLIARTGLIVDLGPKGETQ
jgi:ribonuclease BN (tRNA processing enzyme)